MLRLKVGAHALRNQTEGGGWLGEGESELSGLWERPLKCVYRVCVSGVGPSKPKAIARSKKKE